MLKFYNAGLYFDAGTPGLVQPIFFGSNVLLIISCKFE
jgi:hypothetical protein